MAPFSDKQGYTPQGICNFSRNEEELNAIVHVIQDIIPLHKSRGAIYAIAVHDRKFRAKAFVSTLATRAD